MGKYVITSQKALRLAFWAAYPYCSRKRIPDYQGDGGKMHTADTRCAFVDFVDALQKADTISPQLADRATL